MSSFEPCRVEPTWRAKVMSRAISLYVDRVACSLDALQELEEDAEGLNLPQTSLEDASPDEGSPSAKSRSRC